MPKDTRLPVAIVGGTGLETLPPDWSVSAQTANTPFGSVRVFDARRSDAEILFLSRHGETHALAPHQVNYRANIAALHSLGARQVFATNAVGSLRLDLPPGSLVALDDFIDFTSGRPLSFWDDHPGAPMTVVHTDHSQPYCPLLRSALLEAAVRLDLPLLPRATYLCTNGPRFESPAEVRMFAQWGGDVVGMTGLPEATLAREAGLCYAAVGIVTNFAAGLTAEKVDHLQVVAQMERQVEQVRALLITAASLVPDVSCETCSVRAV